MKKLKRFWFDLTHPVEWYWLEYIKWQIWKLKDYNRLESDYSSVLCHATNSRMSYTNYNIETICSEIDSAKSEEYYDIVKSDILEMIEAGATMEEIKNYVEDLC